jgi:hypothetical protein
MKLTSVFASALLMTVISTNLMAAPKIAKCSVYVHAPRISHSMYGTNSGPNNVNAGVLSVLKANGFTVVTNISKARYSMETEVRCGKMWTFWGPQDSCQTEITFTDNVEEKIVHTDGPTQAKPGLNIDFNDITFPKCSDL